MIVDAQLHEPPVAYAWEDTDEATRHLLQLELQLALMDAVGVERAVLFPVDLHWGDFAAERQPARFGVVPMVTSQGAFGGIRAEDPHVEDLVGRLADRPWVVGLRIVHVVPSTGPRFTVVPLETFDGAVAAAARAGLPLFMSTAGQLDSPRRVARAHPDLTVVVDHLGLPQPPSYRRDDPPFASLDVLLALAELPNIAVKVSGVPTLSCERYPFADVRAPLRRIVDAFGADRLMWGSDWSRVRGRIGFPNGLATVAGGYHGYPGMHTYAEALLFIRENPELTPPEKEAVLGATALRLLRWS